MSIFSPENVAAMKWQNSPLVHAMDRVIEASKYHSDKDSRVGNNKATQMIVHQASELALLRDEIYAGERDGLGYEQAKG